MSRLAVLFPELLLLLVPLMVVYIWRAKTGALGGAVRVVILVLFALVAAVPLAPLGGRGADVVIVADLSRSMPDDSRKRTLEIIRLLEERRTSGDRVGIVSFGREARIERLPEEFAEASEFVQAVDQDGSDLGGANSLAVSLIPRGRPGRVIVISDGEGTGMPVAAASHEAAARGIPIDFRALTRGETADFAV